MRVALVGPAGVGKSTIGTRLAEALDWQFIDLDQAIESRVGRTIPDMFREKGEESFRIVEYDTIRHVTHQCSDECICATGGGIVTSDKSREVLLRAWYTIYLQASPSTLAQRLGIHGHERPLLSGVTSQQELIDRISTQLALREAFYRNVSSHIVNVDGRGIDEVVEELMRWIARHDGVNP